ncbi:hypothetical protein LINGRAPRIM_LOCUS799 [Linum grandiflorum]
MRSAALRLIFNHGFRKRPQLDCVKLDPNGFSKYPNLNTAGLIANLGWTSLFSAREPICFPDAVAQFFCNLQVEGHLMNGTFTTYVDGYFIFVTPQLLSRVLGLPSSGISLHSEAEFSVHNFNPCAALKHWTKESVPSSAYCPVKQLPDYLKTLHFFITTVFLPRSDYKFLVTPLDAWIFHGALSNMKLDYSTLMWAHMTQFSSFPSSVEFPFANEISVLLMRLGIPLSDRYVSHQRVKYMRPQQVLRSIGCLPKSVSDSGGDNTGVSSRTTTATAAANANASGSQPLSFPDKHKAVNAVLMMPGVGSSISLAKESNLAVLPQLKLVPEAVSVKDSVKDMNRAASDTIAGSNSSDIDPTAGCSSINLFAGESSLFQDAKDMLTEEECDRLWADIEDSPEKGNSVNIDPSSLE